MPPGISLSSGGFRLLDQMSKGAVENVLFIFVAAFKLRRLNGMEITPPSITIAAPLGMQCPHSGEGAPQWHAGHDEPRAKTLEQLGGSGAAQSLAHCPDVQFDDLPPKRVVIADRRRRYLDRAGRIAHDGSTCAADCRLSVSPGAGLVEQLLQHLVGLGADDAIAGRHKGRDTGDAPLARFRPIGVDGVLETALGQDRARLLSGKPDRLRDFDQYVRIADVSSLDEVRLVQGVVKRLATRLRVGPFSELLRQPAIVGVGPPTVGQPLGVHQPLHAGVHSFRIDIPSRIKIRHRATLDGCFGMQWEVHPDGVDIEILPQLFNTHGTEIAPGSDVVGKDLQLDRLIHLGFSYSFARNSSFPRKRESRDARFCGWPWTPAFALVHAHISAGTDLSRGSCPSPPACGGRGRDPARRRWEGEVGGAAVRNAEIPHLTPTLSAPPAERGIFRPPVWL